MTRVNLNDYVSVRLNDRGRAIHRADYDTMPVYASAFPYKPPKEDADGWSRWQLWNLMQIYGEHISLGCNPPFETEIKIDERGDPAFEIRPGSVDHRHRNYVIAGTITHDVLNVLTGRKGFDDVWCGCDEDIRDEIVRTLQERIARHLNSTLTT